MFKKLFIILFFAFIGQAIAQEEKTCASVKYNIGHCQLGLKTLTIKNISGVVIGDYTTNKSEKNSEYPMEDFCVILFREQDEKLITYSQTNDRGKFKLKKVPDGDYRLIVKSTTEHNFGLTLASIPLKIDSKANKGKKILVRMVPSGMHSCSYAEIQ